ncbi:MAG: dihydroneopterin aldolase [Armatimonadota bacterium]
MDRILIEDLLVRCILGINEDERREKQDVLINITLSADLQHAGRSDDFQQTIDYRAIKKAVYAMAENSSYYLVEALAERIAEICLEHPKVQEVLVRVAKPSALRFARSVGVEIERTPCPCRNGGRGQGDGGPSV